MNKSIELTEILITGAVGGCIAGAIGLAYNVGASPESVLTFLGSAVGSGLAVFGALWIEAHRRQKAFKNLALSLVIPATVAMRFTYENEKLMEALSMTLRQSVKAFEGARTGTNIDSPLHQYALQTCVFWMESALAEITQIEEKFTSGTMTRTQAFSAMQAEAEKLISPVKDFLKINGIPKEATKTFAHHEVLTNQMRESNDTP